MSAKEVDVTCPSCAARLSVDVLSRKVVRWRAMADAEGADPKVTERDWDAAMGKVSGRLDQGADRFDASLQREQRRTRDLDALFEQLKDDKNKDEGNDADPDTGGDSPA